jgi:hypothetical protein
LLPHFCLLDVTLIFRNAACSQASTAQFPIQDQPGVFQKVLPVCCESKNLVIAEKLIRFSKIYHFGHTFTVVPAATHC